MTTDADGTRRREPRSHRIIPASTQKPVPPKFTNPAERAQRASAALGAVKAAVAVDTDKAIGH